MPTPSTETVLTVPTAKNERFDSQENHSEVPRSPQRPTEANREMLKAMKKQNLADEHARIPVEGKFGNAKRKGTLGRIMAKLRNTSESVIHIGIIVLNLDTWLRAELKSLLDALIIPTHQSFWWNGMLFEFLKLRFAIEDGSRRR